MENSKLRYLRHVSALQRQIEKHERKILDLKDMIGEQKKRIVDLSQQLDDERGRPPQYKIKFLSPPLVNFCDDPDSVEAVRENFRDQKVLEGADIREGHLQIAYKCMSCELHFVALTWFYCSQQFFCPECQQTTLEVVNEKRVELEIFQVVRGIHF